MTSATCASVVFLMLGILHLDTNHLRGNAHTLRSSGNHRWAATCNREVSCIFTWERLIRGRIVDVVILRACVCSIASVRCSFVYGTLTNDDTHDDSCNDDDKPHTNRNPRNLFL